MYFHLPFLHSWLRSDWRWVLCRMCHSLVERTTTSQVCLIFNDFLRHWWIFHKGNISQSKGNKTHFIKPVQCCCLFKPIVFGFCFLSGPNPKKAVALNSCPCLSQGQKTHRSLNVYPILAWLQICAKNLNFLRNIFSKTSNVVRVKYLYIVPNWEKSQPNPN